MSDATNPKEPWGKEHVRAMGRLGLHELRGALYPESNIAQPSEYGIFGSKTPGEVAEDRRSETDRVDVAPHSTLHNAELSAADRAANERSRQDRSRDMDRG